MPRLPLQARLPLQESSRKLLRSYAVSVLHGGIVSWLLIAAVFFVMMFLEGDSEFFMFFVLASLVIWTVYCALVIVVFSYLPFAVVRLGRAYPAHAWSLTVSISMVSSVLSCAGTSWLLSLYEMGFVIMFAVLGCSAIAGMVSGHEFWKRAFPPMDDLSGVFR